MTTRELTGLHVAVTGGARGIGAAIVRRLVDAGAYVSIGDIDFEAAMSKSIELNALNAPGECHAFWVDVADEQAFADYISSAEQRFGSLGALINNAGIMSVGSFAEEPLTTTKKQLDINVLGVMIGTKVALASFEKQDRGHVVNISSIAGRFAFAGIASYTGTKHFVFGFTEAMRSEYGARGIDFSTVMPNIAHTRLGAGVTGIALVPKCEPDDIAKSVVSALRRPRPRVYIPNFVGLLAAATSVVPARAMDRVFAILKADTALTDVDLAARTQYQAELASIREEN